MIILDTDAVTFLERRDSRVSVQLRTRLTTMSADHQIATTVVTYEEQTRGWIATFAEARNAQAIIDAYSDLLQHLETFTRIDVIAYTGDADAHFQDLKRRRLRIGTRDLRIASIALSRGAILFTRNLSDFQKIPNLRVEDWTRS